MILVKAKFKAIKRLKKGSNLIFGTIDEIPSHEREQLINGEGWLAFNQDEYRARTLKIIQAKTIGVNENGLSPSQKLRLTLFNVAQELGVEPEEYYISQMKKITDHYRGKIF